VDLRWGLGGTRTVTDTWGERNCTENADQSVWEREDTMGFLKGYFNRVCRLETRMQSKNAKRAKKIPGGESSEQTQGKENASRQLKSDLTSSFRKRHKARRGGNEIEKRPNHGGESNGEPFNGA